MSLSRVTNSLHGLGVWGEYKLSQKESSSHSVSSLTHHWLPSGWVPAPVPSQREFTGITALACTVEEPKWRQPSEH